MAKNPVKKFNLEISRLLQDEKSAVRSIEKYMLRGFESKIDYKFSQKSEAARRKEPRTSNSSTLFWNQAIQSFYIFSQKLTIEYELPVKEIPLDDVDNPETRDAVNTVNVTVKWEDDIDEFVQHYQSLVDLYLKYTKRRKNADAQFESVITSLRIEKTKKAKRKGSNISLLKEISFSNIEKMLNLKDKTVCALLPYLLTAYIANCAKCHLLYSNSSFLERTFSDQPISSSEAPITRQQIKRFAEIFSFRNNTNPIICDPTDRPKAAFYLLNDPRIRNKAVLWEIFKKWCEIIEREAKRNRTYRLQENLNIEGSKRLLEHYIAELSSTSKPSMETN